MVKSPHVFIALFILAAPVLAFSQRGGGAHGGVAPRAGSPIASRPMARGAQPTFGSITSPGVARSGNIRRGGPGLPNINSPGVASTNNFRARRFRPSGGTAVVYGVPYYVPYYVPYTDYGAPYDDQSAIYQAPPEDNGYVSGPPPMVYPDPSQMGGYPAPYPYPAYPAQPQQTAQAQEPFTLPEPAGPKPVTTLAFKDGRQVVVTNYWMDGENIIYETSDGGQTAIPIDKLDFTLTDQLNQQHGVPFVIRSQP